ncbi:MAG TPA: molecular chaperone HtpG, partial [Planctomycetaceae bacterium]
MSTTTQQGEQFTFQAEIKRLLHLLSHSLYQNREIALRELVSNASDALDKFRHLMLTAGAEKDETEPAISITPDEDAKVLEIADNGVGMTRQELIDNLGTIAHSGSLDFLSKLSGDQKADLSLIGQFGVGFYSAFMLAEKVVVLTHSHSEEVAWRWESDGTGSYVVEPAGFDLPRGTKVRLHLREDAAEFLRPDRLRHVLTKYSTFVPHPIYVQGERVNEQRPIWVEPKSQVTEEQYAKFYQYLSHRFDEKPLWHLHLSADSPFQFHAVLYCPPTNVELLGFGKAEHGLHLCAKRVLVQNDCRQLLPEYLRFLYGLVDSADLPLNVSREALQDNTVFRKIRKVLTKRALDHLGKTAEEDKETYKTFVEQFGPVLREGIATDYENRDRVASLLRFRSTHDDGAGLVSLDEYAERAGEGREQILYAAGPDLGTLRRSPNLEAFRARGVEVLLLTDPIDEIALSTLGRYKDKEVVSVDSAEAKLPAAKEGEEGTAEAEASAAEPPSGFEAVLRLFREALSNEVADVRKSDRLADSPVCLVAPEGTAGYSASLQKVLSMTHAGFEPPKRVLEVNPGNALVRRLAELAANEQNHGFVRDCGRQLYANALLLSGIAP